MPPETLRPQGRTPDRRAKLTPDGRRDRLVPVANREGPERDADPAGVGLSRCREASFESGVTGAEQGAELAEGRAEHWRRQALKVSSASCPRGRHLPLPKTPQGPILASQPPRIWGMSV